MGDNSQIELSLYPEKQHRILRVINELRGQGGESYSERGRRNPVRNDTAPLLTAYAKMVKPKTAVELGTAYGFSGLHLLLGSPQARLFTCEFDEEVAAIAQGNFVRAGFSKEQVIVYAGDAGEFLSEWLTYTLWEDDRGVDLVFFDHEKRLYLPHFKQVEPRLNEGALILADNVNDRRSECQNFVDYMYENYPDTQILPTECGLLVALAVKSESKLPTWWQADLGLKWLKFGL